MSFLNNIPNIISASRSIAAVAMLCFPVFSPDFWVLYCWGGISDMIDGPIARKMNTDSQLGSTIDSAADMVFVICSAAMILPSMDLPLWLWLWTAAIGLIKFIGIAINSFRRRKLSVPHSATNRLTGILLFCLPFAIVRIDALIPAVIVCISAAASLYEDYQIIRK